MGLILVITVSACILFEAFIQSFVRAAKVRIFLQFVLVVVALGLLWGNYFLQSYTETELKIQIDRLSGLTSGVQTQLPVELGPMAVPSAIMEDLQKAEAAINQGNYQEAFVIGRTIAGAHEQFAPAYFYLGTAEIGLGQHEEGKNHLLKAIHLGLSQGVQIIAYKNLAFSADKEGKYDEAIGYLERALSVNPNILELKLALQTLRQKRSKRLFLKYTWR